MSQNQKTQISRFSVWYTNIIYIPWQYRFPRLQWHWLQWQFWRVPNGLSYIKDGVVRVTLAYSDTFLLSWGCHCKRGRLYPSFSEWPSTSKSTRNCYRDLKLRTPNEHTLRNLGNPRAEYRMNSSIVQSKQTRHSTLHCPRFPDKMPLSLRALYCNRGQACATPVSALRIMDYSSFIVGENPRYRNDLLVATRNMTKYHCIGN